MSTIAAVSVPRPSRALHAALWVVQVLLALSFLSAGFMKITGDLAQMAQAMPWAARVPGALVRFIGVAEVAGGLGLILPSLLRIRPALTGFAAIGLVTVMVLAVAQHIQHGEMFVPPLVLGLLAGFVAWGRLRAAPIAGR
jgi:uncharacterized membrane protein YphA (DoxX/SURF4 family)